MKLDLEERYLELKETNFKLKNAEAALQHMIDNPAQESIPTEAIYEEGGIVVFNEAESVKDVQMPTDTHETLLQKKERLKRKNQMKNQIEEVVKCLHEEHHYEVIPMDDNVPLNLTPSLLTGQSI